MSRGMISKITASHRGTEIVVFKRCSYQVTVMVGTNDPKNYSTSFTTRNFRPFQEEEETVPQRLEPCVTIFL